MLIDLKPLARVRSQPNSRCYQLIQKTILYDLEKINYKAVKQKNGEIIIIQKDAAVSVVVDFVESDVAQILIKYNHYFLNP